MGSEDTACPNAERFYVALTEAGKEVVYLLFKGEGHWPGREREVLYVDTAVRWLEEKISPP